MKQILVAMCLLFLCTVGVKAQDETYKKAFFYPLSLNFTSQRYKKPLKSLQGKGKNVTLHETGYDWQGESTLLSNACVLSCSLLHYKQSKVNQNKI